MWRLALLLAFASALTCPKHSCSSTPSSYCVTATPQEFIGHVCKPGTICPDYSFGHMGNVTCVPEDQAVERTQPMCTVKSGGGRACGLSAPCAQNLYCRLPSHTCEIPAKLGAACSALNECGYKSICNLGKCIKRFTIESGAIADSRVACISGRVKNGICQPVSKSIGLLPVKCSTSSDCTGTDGTNATCVCGASASGQAYCSLHPSDDLMLEYLDAVHDREVELIPRLQYEVLHYPELQDPQSCFLEHVVELEKFEVLKDRETRCLSSSWRFLLPLLLLSLLL